jgi:heterodisulfide reductase subunit A
MTIEHARAEARGSTDLGDVTCQVFFMDTRAYSKGYEEYYHRAEEKYGVIYTRCRLSDVKENPINHNLRVRYFNNEDGGQRIVEQEFDLVVLSVGMEISESVKNLGHNLGIELDDYGFATHIIRAVANQPAGYICCRTIQ